MSAVCAKCQGRKVTVERRGSYAFAQQCECARTCEHCGGLGFVYERRTETVSGKMGPRTYDVMVDCACRLRARRVSAFNEVKLPASVSHATFDNYRPFHPDQARAQKVSRSFTLGYSPKGDGRGFILSGPVGTGKTHLLGAALSHLALERGVRCAYVEISLLYATIRRGFNEGKSGGEIIGPLSEVEVLAIDELGKGRGSPFELDTMDELIARRYNAGRTTLFATNYSLAPDPRPNAGHGGAVRHGYSNPRDVGPSQRDGTGEILRDRVGERIYSRLCEMCEFVEMPAGTPDNRRGSSGR